MGSANRRFDPDGAFTEDFKIHPWWWEWAPREERPPEISPPTDADIAIVGSGFTALSAALTLARAGRQVLILEADAPGYGASSRNGGQVGSGNQRFKVKDLIGRFGRRQAEALLREGVAALRYIGDLIRREGIECCFEEVGRFRGANRRDHYEHMARDHADLARLADVEFFMVPRAEQHSEIGTDAYFGGTVLPRDACLHPALYHRGLLERVRQAGVNVIPFTPVLGLERERQRVAVTSARGEISAGEVIVATNGYTGRATPSHEARIIPVPSAIIATEPLEPAMMTQLMPKARVIGETRRVFYYYQACPERRRILFGGRMSGRADAPRRQDFLHLYCGMLDIFPALRGVRISHAWTGFTG